MTRPARPPVVRTRQELRDQIRKVRQSGQSIGLVPTMGALHRGHMSLVEASRNRCDVTVATIFVNPTQFAPHEDFEKYPRTLEADLSLLADAGVDLVFAPATGEMYRPEHETTVDVGAIARRLEGEFRPHHFEGVATVVLKLLCVATPDVGFFGQKDYQQSLVIRRLVEDLDVPVEIEVCPTVRDPDGLALSSRNAYLSLAERQRALAIPRSLEAAAELIRRGTRDAKAIEGGMHATLQDAGVVEIDYARVVDPKTLLPVELVDGRALLVIAAHVGATRLIDNALLG